MQGQEPTRPLTNAMKWLLLAASLFVFLAGIQLFVLTEHTDRYFAWTVDPPLTAALLGGAYWASSIMELLAARQSTLRHVNQPGSERVLRCLRSCCSRR
jgi:hypothetical protein